MAGRYCFVVWALVGVSGALVPGCGSGRAPNADVLKIGAYSVVREVLHEGLLPAFARDWNDKTGRTVTFEESYNGSGAQARAIASGFDADIAILSHEGDMEVLVKAGRVKAGWNDGPRKGIITHSLVVIGHRPGNPKAISDWADLAKPGVALLYPDPKTSGGARWNINAIYGATYLASRQARQGQADLRAWPTLPSEPPVMRWLLTKTNCCCGTKRATRSRTWSPRRPS
jgi:ABC-type sulfate transport system substrate-binding protein